MYLYMVVFDEALSEDGEMLQTIARISEGGPFRLKDCCLLMLTPIDNPKTIRDLIGIGEDSTGAVFKLNGSYSGFYDEKLWEWLRVARENQVHERV